MRSRPLFTPQKTTDGKATGYGMNWHIDADHDGVPTLRHTGSSVGGNSIILIYPRQRLVLAIQTNLTDSRLGELPETVGSLFLKTLTPQR